MATITALSKQEFVNLLLDQYGDLDVLSEVIGTINRWIERGDKAAVYQNEDLGHPDLGQVQIVSYGSSAAQMEVETKEELPDRLPDTPTSINWRYLLAHVYEGEVL